MLLKRKVIHIIKTEMKQGKKLYQACREAGVDASTFYLWRKKNNRLKLFTEELAKRCDSRRTDLVEDAFVKNCVSGGPQGLGNVAAQIFYLKNRGWKDTTPNTEINVNALAQANNNTEIELGTEEAKERLGRNLGIMQRYGYLPQFVSEE